MSRLRSPFHKSGQNIREAECTKWRKKFIYPGKEPEDDFTRELDEAVQEVRKNEKWRLDYMTLQMYYQEKYEQGLGQG
ncbi:MAG: hypothetical protein NC307_04415 [Roseburia sp.]|nr:hypothetical protein [Roseburia sp.]